MACGNPAAAFPVAGPLDVIEPGISGNMHHQLDVDVIECLELDRSDCRNAALKYPWARVAERFLNLHHEISAPTPLGRTNRELVDQSLPINVDR